MGRFLSPDWSEEPDTVPYAEFENPQTLNLYSYARNNPVINDDPDGHDVNVCTTGSNGQQQMHAGEQRSVRGGSESRHHIYVRAANS